MLTHFHLLTGRPLEAVWVASCRPLGVVGAVCATSAKRPGVLMPKIKEFWLLSVCDSGSSYLPVLTMTAAVSSSAYFRISSAPWSRLWDLGQCCLHTRAWLQQHNLASLRYRETRGRGVMIQRKVPDLVQTRKTLRPDLIMRELCWIRSQSMNVENPDTKQSCGTQLHETCNLSIQAAVHKNKLHRLKCKMCTST